MWIKGNVSGGWKSRSVKSELRFIGQILSFSPHLPPLISFLSFFHLFVSFFSFPFPFFFLSFFLQWLRTREISPREILNDEDFNFNVVEILHPVDRTPFYLQSLENFHSSLFFYDSLIFLPIFLNRGKSSLSTNFLNIGFSPRSWHIKTTSSNSNRLLKYSDLVYLHLVQKRK